MDNIIQLGVDSHDSGVCSNCRKVLVKNMDEQCSEDCFVEQETTPKKNLSTSITKEEVLNQSTSQTSTPNETEDITPIDSDSEWLSQPTSYVSQISSEWQDDQDHLESPMRKRKALNTFLDAVGVSPIKKTLTIDFESASRRTQSDYIKKSKDIIHSILSIIAPNQVTNLENAIYTSNSSNDDNELMKSIAKAYCSMTSWGTQRQILSLVVEDHNFNEIKQYIPSITSYKYTAAGKHALINGIGMPLQNTTGQKND